MDVLRVDEGGIPVNVRTFFSKKGELVWLGIIREEGQYFWFSNFKGKERVNLSKKPFNNWTFENSTCQYALIYRSIPRIISRRTKTVLKTSKIYQRHGTPLNCFQDVATAICYRPIRGWKDYFSTKLFMEKQIKSSKSLPYVANIVGAKKLINPYCNPSMGKFHCYPKIEDLPINSQRPEFQTGNYTLHNEPAPNILDIRSTDRLVLLRKLKVRFKKKTTLKTKYNHFSKEKNCLTRQGRVMNVIIMD